MFMRKNKSLFMFSVFVSLYLYCLCLPKNGVGFHNSAFDNFEISSDYLLTEYSNVAVAIGCTMFCAKTLLCLSFSFNKVKQKCRLHRIAVLSLSQGTSSNGWKYFLYGEHCPLDNGFIHDRENDLCVRISEQKLNADNGEQFCTNLSSNLVTLETVDKQIRFDNFLAKFPANFINPNFRMGLHFNGVQWKWNNGKSLTDNRWAEDEPSCSSNCFCGGVTGTLRNWYDNSYYCKNQTARSVCEIQT